MIPSSNLNYPPGVVGGSATYHLPSSRLSRRAAETACAPFFAASARALRLDSDERDAMIDAVIEVLPIENGRPVPLRRQRGPHWHLVVEGWTCRSHTLSDGSRQITDILLPGDLCGRLTGDADDKMNDVRACGRARIAVIRSDAILGHREPALRRAVEWANHREALILRSRLVSVGRRNARKRVAHLMRELYRRLRPVGLANDGTFECPMTQEQFADALGLTSVHVNRTLQTLRRCGALTLHKRTVVISDFARLNAEAGLADEGFSDIIGG
jgi:CRP-like cAMP-binding protein